MEYIGLEKKINKSILLEEDSKIQIVEFKELLCLM